MLPSGNDAGFLLADYFGRMIKKLGNARLDIKSKASSESNDNQTESGTDAETTDSKENSDEESQTIDENERSKYLHRYSLFRYTFVKYFIMEMNYYAQEEFNLTSTMFDSPHGMTNRFNISSAYDIGQL